jgi:hypothetical protein
MMQDTGMPKLQTKPSKAVSRMDLRLAVSRDATQGESA